MRTEENEIQTSTGTILLSAMECAKMCGISRRTWFRLAASLRTPACVRVGASPRWPRQSLELWIALGCPDRKTFEARKEAGRRAIWKSTQI